MQNVQKMKKIYFTKRGNWYNLKLLLMSKKSNKPQQSIYRIISDQYHVLRSNEAKKCYLMLLFDMVSLIWRSSSLMIRSSWVYTPVLNKVSLSSISLDRKSSKPSSCWWDPEPAILRSAVFPGSGTCFRSSCSLNLDMRKKYMVRLSKSYQRCIYSFHVHHTVTC